MKPKVHDLFSGGVTYFFNDNIFWYDNDWLAAFDEEIIYDTRGMSNVEIYKTIKFEDNEVYRLLMSISGALPSEIFA